MRSLVQKVQWTLDGTTTEMYMYGEADFETNRVMQEPLRKLYQYENRFEGESTVNAKFIGKDNSLGFTTNQIYELITEVDYMGIHIHASDNHLPCTYSSLADFIADWKIIRDDITE